jgi:hypothetical protein
MVLCTGRGEETMRSSRAIVVGLTTVIAVLVGAISDAGEPIWLKEVRSETAKSPSDPWFIEVAKLEASDASAGTWFGWSVGVSGDTVVVGRPNSWMCALTPPELNAAYVFE